MKAPAPVGGAASSTVRGTPIIVLAAAAAVGFLSALILQWMPASSNLSVLSVGPSSSGKCVTSPSGAAAIPPPLPGLQSARSGAVARAPPGPNGYLIINEFDFYRFTNNKIQLIEALAMAEATQRTLVAPRFFKCREQSLTQLFDADMLASHVDFIEDPDWTLSLANMCGSGHNVYIKYESFTQGAMVGSRSCTCVCVASSAPPDLSTCRTRTPHR
jgi:hypothetical protein